MTIQEIVKNSSDTDATSVEKLTNRILYAVQEGNELQAREAAAQLSTVYEPRFLEDSLLEWQFFLIRIMTLLVAVIVEPPSVTQHIERRAQDAVKAIGIAKDIERCKEILIRMVDTACEFYKEAGRNYSVLVQKIIEQVALDLKQPLTLQYFSERLNVNSSYLSNLFRQQTGITITEYVTDKRIKHAAMLLSHTHQPIKMVAKQVGITDVQYFSRLFKRRMNMTPSEYRMKAYEERSRVLEEKAR